MCGFVAWQLFSPRFISIKETPKRKKKLEMKWKINRGQVTNETHTLLQIDQWTPVSDLVG